MNAFSHAGAFSRNSSIKYLPSNPGDTFPTSCSETKNDVSGGRRLRTDDGSSLSSPSATYPAYRQWSKTDVPGEPSGHVFALHSRNGMQPCGAEYLGGRGIISYFFRVPMFCSRVLRSASSAARASAAADQRAQWRKTFSCRSRLVRDGGWEGRRDMVFWL